MGIYYIAPSLGPALGPIFGGSLTTGFDWRAVFYFMGIISGTSLALFVIFFKDTFRRERSVSYQRAVKKRLAEREAERLESASQNTVINSPSVNEKSRGTGGATGETDVEAQPPASEFQEVKLTFRDISPFEPIWLVIKRKNNLFTLTCSGM
jgi:MFS family permease